MQVINDNYYSGTLVIKDNQFKVYVEKNGVLAEVYTYKTIKELINAGWRDEE